MAIAKEAELKLLERNKPSLLTIATEEEGFKDFPLPLMSGRNSVRRSAKNSTYKFGSKGANLTTLNDFDQRFGDVLEEAGADKPRTTKHNKGFSVRKGTVKKARGQVVDSGSDKGEEYDNEDAGEEEYDNESSDFGQEDGDEIEIASFFYYSQQPDEVFGIVMDDLRVELTEYLVKDEKYNWEYTDQMITKQMRSKSMDLVQPIEEYGEE